MIDWTELSTDPNDTKAKQSVHIYLQKIRRIKNLSYVDWLLEKVHGRTCLDVGAVEHDLSYTERPTWKHKKLVEQASKVVGVDVLEESVNILNQRGYDIRLCDATSEEYLEEQFDIVVMGDVIEHVANPIDLIRFGIRHLKPGGEVIVKTPNVFYKDHIKKFIKNRAFVNLEHMAWFTPTMMLEIARRAGCSLEYYIVDGREHPWWLRFLNPDLFSRDYVYIFSQN